VLPRRGGAGGVHPRRRLARKPRMAFLCPCFPPGVRQPCLLMACLLPRFEHPPTSPTSRCCCSCLFSLQVFWPAVSAPTPFGPCLPVLTLTHTCTHTHIHLALFRGRPDSRADSHLPGSIPLLPPPHPAFSSASITRIARRAPPTAGTSWPTLPFSRTLTSSTRGPAGWSSERPASSLPSTC
jgi:hypothetical protein